MARPGLPPAWESAPDILRTDFPPHSPPPATPATPSQPRQKRRRHSRSSALPDRQRHHRQRSHQHHRQQVHQHQRGRNISRRGTYPEERTSQWLEHHHHHITPRPVNSPPYPVTPPPSVQRPRQSVLPATLGYRAPTPLPQPALSSILPTNPTTVSETHPRLVHVYRYLDSSLPTLGIATLVCGTILLIAGILFVRSTTLHTAASTASRNAFVVFFALAVAAFVIAFALVLGVLCRRARKSQESAVKARVREAMELRDSRGVGAGSDGLPRWDKRHDRHRRGAMCEEEQGRGRADSVGHSVGYPLVASRAAVARPCSRARSSPVIEPARKPPSPLIPTAINEVAVATPSPSPSPPSIPTRNPARLQVCFDASSTKVQAASSSRCSSAAETISPRTTTPPSRVKETLHDLPTEIETIRDSTVSGLSSRIFTQHMLTAGTRELQAYLDATSTITTTTATDKSRSLDTLALGQSVSGDSGDDVASSPLAMIDGEESEHSKHEEEEKKIQDEYIAGKEEEASALSVRKVGKAKKCFIAASSSSSSGSSAATTTTTTSSVTCTSRQVKKRKQRPSRLEIFTEHDNNKNNRDKGSSVEVDTERHQSILPGSLPSAPLLLPSLHNQQATFEASRRARGPSPKKMAVPEGACKKVIGLGISLEKQKQPAHGKENVDPEFNFAAVAAAADEVDTSTVFG